MQEGINSVGNAVFSWNENAKSKKTLRAENERLQEKIDVLKMQNRVLQQNQVELERLQDLLKLKQNTKSIIQWEPESSVKDQETGLTSF